MTFGNKTIKYEDISPQVFVDCMNQTRNRVGVLLVFCLPWPVSWPSSSVRGSLGQPWWGQISIEGFRSVWNTQNLKMSGWDRVRMALANQTWLDIRSPNGDNNDQNQYASSSRAKYWDNKLCGNIVETNLRRLSNCPTLGWFLLMGKLWSLCPEPLVICNPPEGTHLPSLLSRDGMWNVLHLNLISGVINTCNTWG